MNKRLALANNPTLLTAIVDLVRNEHYNNKQLAAHFDICVSAFRRFCKENPHVKEAIDQIRLNSEVRICKKCKVEKPASEFQKDATKKSGYLSACKLCNKEYHQSHYTKNKELINARNKDWYENNKIERGKKISQYRDSHKQRFATVKKQRLANDPIFCLRIKLRDRICQAFKVSEWKKQSNTETLIGCDYQAAKEHIKKQFKDGMTWANHGQWHIDHKTPLASATTEDELNRLCHYTNLQPLWAVDNVRKGAKIVEYC